MPDAPRYLYPETLLFLWIGVELAAAWWDAGPARTRTVVAGFATGVMLLGVWSNVAMLDDASSRIRAGSMIARGEYSAYDLERGRLRPSYTPHLFLPSAGSYLSAAAAFGSIGLSPEKLARASQLERASADRALVGALGLSLTPAPRAHGGCVQPPLAGLDLPPGGAWIGGRGLGDATFTLGRFADPPVTRLTPQPGVASRAVLRIPSDSAGVPWKLQIASRNTITVCGLRVGA
jgi:hypothetical protein